MYVKYLFLFTLIILLSYNGYSQFGYNPIQTVESVILENDPKNANDLSINIQPIDFKFLLNNYRLSANIDVLYRLPNERIWINGMVGYDYFIKSGNAIEESRPNTYNSSDYNKPSYSYKIDIGYNFYSKFKKGERRVLINGRFSNIKTYALVDADHYQSFGVNGGFENYTRYIYSEYSFNKTIGSSSNLIVTDYGTSETESYGSISYISAGFHYQTVDHLKIKVDYYSKERIKTNKSVVIYYFDLLFPVSRKFADANVLVGVDSLFNEVYKTLPVSSGTKLSSIGFKVGLNTIDIAKFGANAGIEMAFLPGPQSSITNLMLNFKLGFSINTRIRKTHTE